MVIKHFMYIMLKAIFVIKPKKYLINEINTATFELLKKLDLDIDKDLVTFKELTVNELLINCCCFTQYNDLPDCYEKKGKTRNN